MGHLREGLPARIKLDAFDHQRYGVATGTVSFIAPDSGTQDGHTARYLGCCSGGFASASA
jgi:hypothetical protein